VKVLPHLFGENSTNFSSRTQRAEVAKASDLLLLALVRDTIDNLVVRTIVESSQSSKKGTKFSQEIEAKIKRTLRLTFDVKAAETRRHMKKRDS